MKTLYTLTFSLLILFIYNTKGQSITQSVQDAIQTTRTLNQTKKEITGQTQREREVKQKETQEREDMKLKLSELKGSYYDLDHRIELVENVNKQIDDENDRLYKRIYALEQETDRLKAENESYRRSFSELVERINRLEITSTQPSQPTQSEPSGVYSVISTPKSSSHRTYTPKSSQYYIRGPRGGCYYLTASGRKQYVDRSLCN
ncbi:hypothetical protein [Spirosoma aerolatum]|uniref:hypothetical protein n=1 Tax=Spirosoma aerolatum TaxID=1211326 RepID=UPI0009ADBF0D|nr:hypothetical protein [Spirosoma aerolatum]